MRTCFILVLVRGQFEHPVRDGFMRNGGRLGQIGEEHLAEGFDVEGLLYVVLLAQVVENAHHVAQDYLVNVTGGKGEESEGERRR